MFTRRSILKAGAASALTLTVSHRLDFALAAQNEEFPKLTLTVADDGFDFPTELAAGRYAIDVLNSSSGESHTTLALLPQDVTQEEVATFFTTDTEETPDWALSLAGAGAPDGSANGETRSGIIDLAAGTYVIFNIFGNQPVLFVTVTGDAGDPAEPDAALEVIMQEMSFTFPADKFASGPMRIKLTNKGALVHEAQILAVPDGTTRDQVVQLFAMAQEPSATPEADLAALADTFDAWKTTAAMSMLGPGRSSWLDLDLTPGTYTIACPLPFPTVPHMMLGMVDVFTVD